MKPIEELNRLELAEVRRKFPTCPYPVATKHKDGKANSLTLAIKRWVILNGGKMDRISVTGRPIDNTKIVTDSMGNRRMIGSVQYIKSSMKRGSADLEGWITTKSGKIIPLAVEVKIGRDRIRPDQDKYREYFESTGGRYFIAKDFNSFYEFYNNLINT